MLSDSFYQDVIKLTQSLIRCKSVTPQDAGALATLEDYLIPFGFKTRRMPFTDPQSPPVDNSFITYTSLHNTSSKKHFCFAGHTDVVPASDEKSWRSPPFSADIHDNLLIGRGAVDMKGAIACFAVASTLFCKQHTFDGKISLMITGDEEGPSINGTKKMVETLIKEGEHIDACLVGEPTCEQQLGDVIKIGRRGNFYGTLTAHGTWGHTGYVKKGENAAENLAHLLHALSLAILDCGNDFFEPSTLAITDISTPNEARNVIPGQANALFNIRFNTEQTEETLLNILHGTLKDTGLAYTLEHRISCAPFLTQPGDFTDIIKQSITNITGKPTALKTTGGTSDARFIKDMCPVVDFGLCNQTIHQTNEAVALDDLKQLTLIYFEILKRFFL